MVGKVGVDEAGGIHLPGGPLNGVQDPELVFHVQVGLGLVQNEQLRPGDQGPGHHYHLQLAPGELVAVPARQLPGAQQLQNRLGPVVALPARGVEKALTGVEAHHHHVQHPVGKDAALGLGDIADLLPELPVGVGPQGPSGYPGLPPAPVEEIHNALEQCGLAYAVRAQNGHDLPVLQAEGDLVQNGGTPIGEAPAPHFQNHEAPPEVFRSIHAKKGAPMMAVRMERGISAAVAVRATVSMASR